MLSDEGGGMGITMHSITEIKKEFLQIPLENYEEFIAKYETDERKGVQTIITSAKNKLQKLKLERERLENMTVFEKKYRGQYTVICGIDEAGRGPLAGPVVAGACILPKEEEILYLNDSKKLSPAKREELYEEITRKALAWSVGIASPERIDQINILQATYEAMRNAIADLKITPDLLLVDAVTIPKLQTKQVGIIKGDAKSVSIAAASILAKVTRDRMMDQYDEVYPEYGFIKHKGYGTAEHIAALKKYGPCPIHRQSFIQNFIE